MLLRNHYLSRLSVCIGSVLLFTMSLHAQTEIRCIQNNRTELDSSTVRKIALDYGSRLKSYHQRVALPDVIRIPVVVHVIHHQQDGAIKAENISDAQIMSQIRILNEDFRKIPGTPGYNTDSAGADTEIEFYLASETEDCLPTSGITRTYYGLKQGFRMLNAEERSLVKSIIRWNPSKYMNIWVISSSDPGLGYTQFPNYSGLAGLDSVYGPPEEDGIIVRHTVFGDTGTVFSKPNNLYAKGRTLTHEVGHWLGLIHTWGDKLCYDDKGNSVSCECGEDFCDDTPPTNDGNLANNCNSKFADCGKGAQRVMTENYMDYSPDMCMNIFTKEQKKRMRSVFLTSPERRDILNSNPETSYVTDVLRGFYWIDSRLLDKGWQYLPKESVQFMEVNGNQISTFGTAKGTLQSPWLAQPNETKKLIFSLDMKSGDTVRILVDQGCKIATFTAFSFIHTGDNEFYSNVILEWQDFSQIQSAFFRMSLQVSPGVRLRWLREVKNESSTKAYSTPEVKAVYKNASAGGTLDLYTIYDGFKDVQVEILDVGGRRVWKQEFINELSGVLQVPIQVSLSGLYLLRTTIEGKEFFQKIVLIPTL